MPLDVLNIEGIHYDIKFKLEEVDSNMSKGLKIPELDWAINEAQEIIIKSIAQPRRRSDVGFEITQRTIDDIRPLVCSEKMLKGVAKCDATSFLRVLPEDYMYHIKSYSQAQKNTCFRTIRNFVVQQDDLHEEDSHSVSSFEWEEINAEFTKDGLIVFTDGTFDITGVKINYIRRPQYAHLATKHNTSGQYRLPNGTLLSGSQDVELPPSMHREIGDIAVAILTGIFKEPKYSIMLDKLRMVDNR